MSIKLNNLFIVIVFIITSGCKNLYPNKKDITSENYYKYHKALKYLESSKLTLDYVKNQEEDVVKPISLKVSNNLIPINLNAVEIDVLKKDYGISISDLHNNHSKVNGIVDSLNQKTAYFESEKFISQNIKLKWLSTSKKSKLIVFFSKQFDDYLYCELFYNYREMQIFPEDELFSNYSGEVISFLFKYSGQDEILKVYEGGITYN